MGWVKRIIGETAEIRIIGQKKAGPIKDLNIEFVTKKVFVTRT